MLTEPEIAVRNLCRDYEVGGAQVHALRGIDLEVQSGEFVAVVGVSGSGKSTLLHLIGGLDTPTAGEVVVSGRDLNGLSSKQRALFRRQAVGFVFQSFYLVPHLTAEGNLRLALTFQGTFGERRNRLAVEALERVGLAERIRHRPGQLSAGEQQRVAVARAIVHQPRVLLADEPTGNLDHATAFRLLELLRQIQAESGMTIVMVTHDEELVSGFCDRRVRLRDGVIIDSISAA
jgi:putative ABC transport system ATP-binding protein